MTAPLTDQLHEAFPDLEEVTASKNTLTVVSRLIEDLARTAPGVNVLISAFQRREHWTQARQRYLALSEGIEIIALYADVGPDPDVADDGLTVSLHPGHPFEGEWIVLALGAELAVVLCGQQTPADDGPAPRDGDELADGDRLFRVLWSYDPFVVRSAADRIVAGLDGRVLEGARPARVKRAIEATGHPDARAVARAADQLTAGMLERLEHARLRERLADRRTSEAKTAFLARMGHELRNPLNAIMGYAQLLELGDGPDADTAERIGRAGRHLLMLVDEVLDVSQVESGNLRVDLATLEVTELVQGSIELIRTQAAMREIAIGTRDVQALHVRADHRLVIGVLLNLLSNAVGYSPRGGRVDVSVVAVDGTARISVADSGPGIAAEDIPRVFEPFQRLPGTADRAKGTGLGLALSRSMASAMDGRLELESEVGRGSTFTLVLPLADDGA